MFKKKYRATVFSKGTTTVGGRNNTFSLRTVTFQVKNCLKTPEPFSKQ